MKNKSNTPSGGIPHQQDAVLTEFNRKMEQRKLSANDKAPPPDPSFLPMELKYLHSMVLWAKVISTGTVGLMLVEVTIAYKIAALIIDWLLLTEIFLTLQVIRAVLSIAANGWLTNLSWRFAQRLDAALKDNDNDALEEAFTIQNEYFKWVFGYLLGMVLFIVFSFLADLAVQ